MQQGELQFIFKVFGTPVMQKTLLLMLIMALAAVLWPSKSDEENPVQQIEITTPALVEYGYATYYASYFEGRPTSSGQLYYHHLPTAAHPTLPLGTKVKVTHIDNKQSVIVTINDRGPYAKGRIIDLSKSAFGTISDLNKGVIFVSVEEIN
jgi:rare lipoprotein A